MSAPTTSPWPYQETFQVPYHDIDALNHLNHAAYFVYMETLRCGYYLSLTGELDPTKLDIIIAEAACRYFAPVSYNTRVLGEVAPARTLGRTSFTLLYRFSSENRDTVYARGRTVIVTYNYSTSSKQPIPPDRRAQLERDGVNPEAEGW